MAAPTIFQDGTNSTFGVPDSPVTNGIAESIQITEHSEVVILKDAKGIAVGKTIVPQLATMTAKVQLTGVNGPVYALGDVVTLGFGGFNVTEASAAYSQGGYAYQNISGTETLESFNSRGD